jgi:hypothetical protein
MPWFYKVEKWAREQARKWAVCTLLTTSVLMHDDLPCAFQWDKNIIWSCYICIPTQSSAYDPLLTITSILYMHQFGPLHVSSELRILIHSTKHVSDSTMPDINTKAIVCSLKKLSKMYYIIANKHENGRKRSKTDLRYRKTKAVGSGYFYI